MESKEKKPCNMNPSGKIQGLGAIGYNIELRDLFAMAAMHSLMSQPALNELPQQIANRAYEMADVMLRTRGPSRNEHMPGNVPPSV